MYMYVHEYENVCVCVCVCVSVCRCVCILHLHTYKYRYIYIYKKYISADPAFADAGAHLGQPEVWNLALLLLATATMASYGIRTPQVKATGNSSRSHAPAIYFYGCSGRLPALERLKTSRKPFPRNWQFLRTFEPPASLSQATGNNSRSHAPAICFYGPSSLPFARPRTPQTIPQAFPRQLATTTLAATCSSHMFLRAFEPQVTYFFGDSQVLWCCV